MVVSSPWEGEHRKLAGSGVVGKPICGLCYRPWPCPSAPLSVKVKYTLGWVLLGLLILAAAAAVFYGLWWWDKNDDRVTFDECEDQGGHIVVDDGEQKCDLP